MNRIPYFYHSWDFNFKIEKEISIVETEKIFLVIYTIFSITIAFFLDPFLGIKESEINDGYIVGKYTMVNNHDMEDLTTYYVVTEDETKQDEIKGIYDFYIVPGDLLKKEYEKGERIMTKIPMNIKYKTLINDIYFTFLASLFILFLGYLITSFVTIIRN